MRRHPPDAVMRLVNPIMRAVIGRGRASQQLLLLHYSGRKTGRSYDVPAGYHLVDGVVCVLTSSGWRHNFAGGREIEVTLHGRRRAAHAQLVDDPDQVTALCQRFIRDLGVGAAGRRLGLHISVDREPTFPELRQAIERSGLAIIRIHPY